MPKYVLKRKNEGCIQYLVRIIKEVGFPITTRYITEAKTFDSYFEADSEKDMIAGVFDIMEI